MEDTIERTSHVWNQIPEDMRGFIQPDDWNVEWEASCTLTTGDCVITVVNLWQPSVPMFPVMVNVRPVNTPMPELFTLINPDHWTDISARDGDDELALNVTAAELGANIEDVVAAVRTMLRD